MIVKRNFHPLKVWSHIKEQVLFVLSWSFIVWLLFHHTEEPAMALNFTPIGILGSALAIFVAFRNNSAYGRWWEARSLWSGILNSSRVFARLVITFTDSHAHQDQYDRDRSEHFKRSLIYKQIAWANAVRLQLREQDNWVELESFLSAEDFKLIQSKDH